ncbi:MAG: DUF1501 domain-containing protein [Phycisphaerales bacterium]|jgi:uncharacterized protein (DUF1501 family)
MDDPATTLVIVFLRGGADGLSLVPPIADDAYHRARPTLRVKREDAIDLDGRFGLHRDLAPLEAHFREGRLAIVHGAGSQDGTRSHFEAQDFMEHGGPLGGGWLARYLRARGPSPSALAAVAIGSIEPESLRGAPSGAVIQSISEFGVGQDDPTMVQRLERLYAATGGPLGAAGAATIEAMRKLGALRRQANEEARARTSERGASRGRGRDYPDTPFGRGMREIATLIRADLGVVATTIDMIGGGLGWDTHFVQGQAMPALRRELGEGIDAFWSDLESHRERVTLVVMTEFGRRVRENTSLGTDHGAGSVMLVMDEAHGATPFTGGTVHSGWRDLTDSNLLGPGDVPVTTDYRAVLAPILQRHAPGIALASVFPGLP